MPHAPHTRYAPTPSQHTRPPRYHPSQGLCHAALPPSMKATLLHAPTPSVLPPPVRAMPHAPRTRYASSPSQHPRPRKGLCHTHAPRAKCCNAFPCSPSFLRRKREPHNNQNITYYNITCNVYPNRSKDYTKKRGNLFLYRLNLLSLHDES